MGCCLTIILLVCAMVLVAIYFAAGLLALDIIFLILFIASLGQLSDAKKMTPSQMHCRNCKSANVKLTTRSSGRSTNSIYGSWSSQRETTIHYKRIAECKDCGFTWDYLMPEDVEQAKSKANASALIYGIILAILVMVSISVFF